MNPVWVPAELGTLSDFSNYQDSTLISFACSGVFWVFFFLQWNKFIFISKINLTIVFYHSSYSCEFYVWMTNLHLPSATMVLKYIRVDEEARGITNLMYSSQPFIFSWGFLAWGMIQNSYRGGWGGLGFVRLFSLFVSQLPLVNPNGMVLNSFWNKQKAKVLPSFYKIWSFFPLHTYADGFSTHQTFTTNYLDTTKRHWSW